MPSINTKINKQASNTKAKPLQARVLASQILAKVFEENKTLSTLLPIELEKISDPRERAFTQALCFGVMRHIESLNLILDELLDKKIKKKDADIKALILMGLYQLDYMRTPPHAAVSATVDCCKTLKKIWAKNLVNAILRRYQRQKLQLKELVETHPSARFEHPSWLLDMIKRQYPEQWQSIIAENNSAAPMSLRVNAKLIDRKSYLEILQEVDIAAEASSLNEHGLILSEPVNVDKLPGFFEGHVSVQDLAAQLSLSILTPEPHERILDACSAPGGKLAHLLENNPELDSIVAVEKETKRFQKLEETLKRLQLSATLINDDARTPERWWDGEAFDRIMIDAPCSASGVIRRHPDIKYLRSFEEIEDLAKTQQEILNALWPLLKKGGKLLYITCSIFAEENDNQIEAFLNQQDDAEFIPIKATWGTATNYGRQILPGEQAMDGFYYAQIHKK